MDTSPEYIKMSGMAKKIQMVRPNPNDENSCDGEYTAFFYLPKKGKIEILKWDNDEGHPIIGDYGNEDEAAVWLPRQDELQGMINQPQDFIGNWPIILMEKVVKWSEICRYGIYTWGESFEQLWLAFVMKEKFNKTWNGEDWI